MKSFLYSVHTWLLSVWSHHPTTWYGWSSMVYVLTVTIGIGLWIFGRRAGDLFLIVAGLSAATNAIASAYLGRQFYFWFWALVALALLSRPLFHLRAYLARRRAAQAAQVVPPKTKPAS